MPRVVQRPLTVHLATLLAGTNLAYVLQDDPAQIERKRLAAASLLEPVCERD